MMQVTILTDALAGHLSFVSNFVSARQLGTRGRVGGWGGEEGQEEGRDKGVLVIALSEPRQAYYTLLHSSRSGKRWQTVADRGRRCRMKIHERRKPYARAQRRMRTRTERYVLRTSAKSRCNLQYRASCLIWRNMEVFKTRKKK